MLNPIEEAKFAELKGMCRELKVPAPPEIFIGLKVHDRNGVLVFDDRQRGHSWTRNFYNYLFTTAGDSPGDGGASFGAGYMSATNTAGAIAAGATCTCRCFAYGQIAAGRGLFGDLAVLQGIVLGTGDTAFSVEQYALVAPILEGTGTGQFSHQAMDGGTVAYTALSTTWTHTRARTFNNNSGGSITVKEVGLYSELYAFSGFDYLHMLERTVLSPTVGVADGAQLTVTYEISMDFAAIDV